RELVPRLARVRRLEDGRVLDAGEEGVGVRERGLQVPHALEDPRLFGAVVPLVRADLALVRELVPRRLPYLAAVVRALDLLPEPAARLRRVEAVRIGRGALQVVHLPAREVRTVDVPLLALAVRRQDERALLRADQDSDSAHVRSLPRVSTARSDLSIAG